MYIRKTDGRDRGQCFDVREEEARELVAHGQATAVDFSEPDPLGAREIVGLPVVVTDLVPPGTVAVVPEVVAHSFQKPAAGKFHKKSSR
jgi:hypothetical protein